MGRTLREVLASLPMDEQNAIEARFQELNREVESLQPLRQIAGKVQADVAKALRIKQPSVFRIEKQADMYLSTLRGYVEAIGGELELIVRLPSRPPLRLQQLGDLFPAPDEDAYEPAARPSPPRRSNRRSAIAARGA